MKDVPVRSTSQSWPGATMALPSGCPGNVAYEICEFYHHVQAASEAINLAGVLLQGERPKEAIQILNDVVDDMSESGWLASLSNPLAYLAIPTSIVRMDYQLPSIFSCSVENITPDHDTNKDFSSSSSPSNYFSFYARSFCFTDERPRTHHAWLRRMRLLPAVLFYNLGLAHHILALDIVASSSGLELAFHYYQMSLEVAEEALRLEIHTSPDYSLLLLALSNNMGFVCSHFFEDHKALQFAGRLLTTFASIDCARWLPKEEYVFYYMNLLFVLNRYPVFAPAA